MKHTDRNQTEIIDELKQLTKEKGFIYSYCNIILHDLLFFPEELQNINYFERININEAILLLGLWAQSGFNYSVPKDIDSFLTIKYKGIDLLEELHYSLSNLLIKNMEPLLGDFENSDLVKEKPDDSIWKKEGMMIEPIFYGDSGIYDFQYLTYLEQKYKYDEEWFQKNYSLKFEEAKTILLGLKNLIQFKFNKSKYLVSPIYVISSEMENIYKEMEKQKTEKVNNLVREFEISVYKSFFLEYEFKKYCLDLFSCFCFTKKEIANYNENFLNNYTLTKEIVEQNQIYKLGDHNAINSNPIIKIDGLNYFLPITFPLYQAVYENPYYRMIKDKSYKDIASINRGKVGEEMFYNILLNVFSKDKIFKTVKIKSNKSETVTDIDVLCILGNKALIIQIKSKKLTLLSKQGNVNQIEKDFKKAIQEAYEQGLKSRKCILEHNAKFYDELENEIELDEEINECYIICGTTEVYSALGFLLQEYLVKNDSDPYPIAFSIFDLELILHYLKDPYDFIYYIKQRTSLSEYYKFQTEMDMLGYHLTNKIYKTPRFAYCHVDSSFAQMIDRNYYPLKTGIDISDKGDQLKELWSNEEFGRLLKELKRYNTPKIVDLVFRLLELSGDTRDTLVDLMRKNKSLTINDNKMHNFSLGVEENNVLMGGITFFTFNSKYPTSLANQLSVHCERKKYTTKSNYWIGFGSLMNSPKMVDMVYFNDTKWEYDKVMDDLTNRYPLKQGQLLRFTKTGRNKPCNCGSGIKFKNCCGKNK